MRLSKAMGKVAEQERRAARIGNTRKRFDELGAFPMASLRVGWGGRLVCCAARPMAPHRSSRRACHTARPKPMISFKNPPDRH